MEMEMELQHTTVSEVKKLTRDEQVEAFDHSAFVIDTLPEEDRKLFISDHVLPRDQWKLITTEHGKADDLFIKKEVFLKGVRRSHMLNMLHSGRMLNRFAVMGTDVTPQYHTETTWKTRADQMKAFDVMRCTMLGALSYLGRSETNNQPGPT